MTEKTEKPTSYKLQKAKEKGQVNKSTELNNSLFLIIVLSLFSAMWPQTLSALKNLSRMLLISSSKIQLNTQTISTIDNLLLNTLMGLWMPLAIISVLSLVLISIGQSGFTLSTHPLIPDFKRLNPAQGFKKLWSLKTCFEALKSILKITSVSLLIICFLKHMLREIMQLKAVQAPQATYWIMSLLIKFLFQLACLLLLLALIDKLFTRWKFLKDQAMSKQELKEEYKQKEGDPQVKMKRKQTALQLRHKIKSLHEVKTADVVLTNPTHLAIALKYDRTLMPAPKVVCKAQDEMAIVVKNLAQKHQVPIIEDKAFARMLYHGVELNHYITKAFYPLAANLFRTIYVQRGMTL